jgi:hypothetical protein
VSHLDQLHSLYLELCRLNPSRQFRLTDCTIEIEENGRWCRCYGIYIGADGARVMVGT